MNKLIEIRSYTLKEGSGAEFQRLMQEQSLPMLARWKVDVVFCGPSLDSADAYCLIRAYASLEDRQQSQDAFYGSDEWRKGPREAILALIETYTSIAVEMDEAAIEGLRRIREKPLE